MSNVGWSNVKPFPDWLNCSVDKLVVLYIEMYKGNTQSGGIFPDCKKSDDALNTVGKPSSPYISIQNA